MTTLPSEPPVELSNDSVAARREWPTRFGLVGLALACLAWPLVFLFVDVPVSEWVHRQAFSRAVVKTLSIVRQPGIFFPFTVIIAGLLLWRARGRWHNAVLLLIGTALASLVTAIAKYVFGRSRPFKGRDPFDWRPFQDSPLHMFTIPNLSFPSGDVTLAFATAAIVARLEPRWRFVAYAWAIAVGATRVLQGAHYPADALGGAIVGVGCAWLSMRFVPLLWQRDRATTRS